MDFEKWIKRFNTLNETINSKEEIQNEVQVEVKEEIENVLPDDNTMSKMDQDAKYIKEKFSLIKPATGEISSKFGPRNPTTETVPKYHTGIDIAVPEGTTIISSMDGIVEKVSSEGDYRKSYKNIQ